MLKRFRQALDRIRVNPTHKEGNLPAFGLYYFKYETDNGYARVHLRIEPGDQQRSPCGTLLINANRVVQLNYTAAILAYFTLAKTPQEMVVKALTQNFQVSPQTASKDYAKFLEEFTSLIAPDGPCPVCDLNLDILPPFSNKPIAPYRMDLALTYRCNNDCLHCYNARPRNYAELSTNQWMTILERLWDIGIPHVVFTGGEPTLRDDLPDLISHAQSIGLITGLNTNGRRLCDKRFVEQLVLSGLDHVQITIESHEPSIHDKIVMAKGAWQQTVKGIVNALDTPLYVMTNTTLLRDNSPYIDQTLDFLSRLGVSTVGLNGLIYSGRGVGCNQGLKEHELYAILNIAKSLTQKNQQRLIWYTPTQYCSFDPMELELGVKGCTAALHNMCVEPDGGVIPCQSYYQSLGNILSDAWDAIWNHTLCIALRERRYVNEQCKECLLLAECGGGCPLFEQQMLTSQANSTRIEIKRQT